MLRILLAFFTLSGSFLGLGAIAAETAATEVAAMDGQASDRHAELAESAPAEPQFRPGPYVYQNATNLDSCFALVSIANPGQTFTCGGSFSATATTELKLPDADDPALVWYMPEGPIRFYLPSREVSDLSQASWRYKDCHYQIASIDPRLGGIKRYPDAISTEEASMMLVESRCDEIPGKAVLYLFDFRIGLLSFTLGETATAGGKRVFVPKETYHLMANKSGFGQPFEE